MKLKTKRILLLANLIMFGMGGSLVNGQSEWQIIIGIVLLIGGFILACLY